MSDTAAQTPYEILGDDGIKALANIAAEVNQSVENIGARRLYTVMERVFEELSFSAPDRSGEAITVNAAFVEENLGELMRSSDRAATCCNQRLDQRWPSA